MTNFTSLLSVLAGNLYRISLCQVCYPAIGQKIFAFCAVFEWHIFKDFGWIL